MGDFSQYLKPESGKVESSDSTGITEYVDVFGSALAHSLIQNPVNAVGEIAEKATGKELVKNWQIIDAPAAEQEGSLRWHVQQFGNATGTFVPCALLMKGAVGLAGRESGLVRQTLASGLAGSIYGGLLTPTGKPVTADELAKERLTTAATTGASFAFIHLLSTGAFRTAEALSAGDVSLSTALKTRTGAALISAPVGYLAAELDGKIHGREVSQAQKVSSMYTFGLMSFVAGGARRVEASEKATSIPELGENGGLRLEPTGRSKSGALRPATARFLEDLAPARDLATTPKPDFLVAEPRRPLQDQTARLSAPRPDEIKVPVPKLEGPVDPKNVTFETETRTARTYRTDTGIEISVPEDYAKILDKVREYRLAVETNPTGDKAQMAREMLGENSKYADRALPEDFLDGLDRLPDRGLVKRLVLMNEANPEDAVVRQLLGDDRYYSAAVASPNGEITFFQRYVDTEIGRHAGHEWSHLLRYSLQNSPQRSVRMIPELFDVAAAAERTGPLMQGRASIIPEEAWASFGEEVLSGSGSAYRNALAQAPARAALMGRALSESLAAAEAAGRQGFLHEFWKQRAAEMQAQLPRAIDNMVRAASAGSPQSADAARFVAYEGTAANLQAITGLSKLDLSGPLTNDAVLAKLPGVNWIAELDLSGGTVSDVGLRNVARLPLRSLNLSQTMVNDRAVQNLTGMKELQDLGLAGTRVTERGLSELRRIRTLNTVNLTNTVAADAAPNITRGLTVIK